jgi:hypothetical protein
MGSAFQITIASIIALVFWRNYRRWTKTVQPEGSGPVTYNERVRVWVWKSSWGHFTTLKNGFGGIALIVQGDVISVRLLSVPRALAAMVNAEYTLRAGDTNMRLMKVGWMGPIGEHECVVLRGGGDELAVWPRNKDVATLHQALADAGVRSEVAYS